MSNPPQLPVSRPTAPRTLESALLRKLGLFMKFSDEEISTLAGMERSSHTFAIGDELIGQGDPYAFIYIIRSGWAIRYKLLADGSRQIINFVLPGDLVCFDAAVFEQSESAVAAVTKVVAARFEPHTLVDLAIRSPRVALTLAWCNARDEQVLIERIVSLGRRSAYQRMAHLLTELWRRLYLLGLSESNQFEMPLTQTDIADTLGISLVHVNRIVQKLRSDQLIEIDYRPQERIVRILDPEGLQRAASFEDGYLHYTEVPARIETLLRSREVARHSLPVR